MRKAYRLLVITLTAAGLMLTACNRQAQEAPVEKVHPATVEHLSQTGPVASRITLTDEAAKKLDVQTMKVADTDVSGTKHMTIPYAAVLYDVNGKTWTYTNATPLVYERQSITVDSIKGDNVTLKDALPAGSTVVTVGATELYGSETEFQEE